MHFNIDSRFKEHFLNLKQVFLYITDECNLRCVHCLYKPDLNFHLKEKEIKLETALALISDFKEMGASKLTIMGGEPTLYGASQDHIPLVSLISESRSMGYEYIRMDTDGVFAPPLLSKFADLNEITFSLDGPTPEINDPIRGKGVFNSCVLNIRKAVELGYHVDITCCLHRGFAQRNEAGHLLLDLMIEFAESLGVTRINFHDLFKTGLPRDTWTGNLDLSLKEWINIYTEIQTNIAAGKYEIPVRMPQCFVNHEEFEKSPEYYGYCSSKMGERALIHPNGIIRVCSLLIGTPYGVARFYDNKIVWDESPTNELHGHDLKTSTPCTNQAKSKHFGNFVPLCVSFKPRQDEIVWTKKLNWEAKRKD